MNEYVDVDIIENGKVIGTMKVLKKTEEPEEQKIKMEKVDDKTAYDYLIIKLADLLQKKAELEEKVDKAIDLLRMCQNTYLRDPELKIEVEQFLKEIKE